MYSKNDVAPVPPLGWNSYDYYNTMVREEDIRKNAAYMAAHLNQYGWEYIIIDIQWSDPDAGTCKDTYQYIPFSQFCLDEWSRQIPAPNRFPSSTDGKGFKPLADYIHSLHLKFGIHIMRGIPRAAAHNHLAIKTHDGSILTADKIANPYSISKWNPDMYGVDYKKEGAQDYYDSLFELYAAWGVDYVKVDDICNTNMYPQNPYSGEKEIEMIAHAIKNSGRPMVLSLSPGPALIEKAWHLSTYANMWRITDDFWDDWKLLYAMFERCEIWQKQVSAGCWPDCDMLPVGTLGYGFGCGIRKTQLTALEQYTMMTLWCIFRSPLIIGTDLPQLDSFTTSLLTNTEVLAVQKRTSQAYLAEKTDVFRLWTAPAEHSGMYAALFNLGEKELSIKGSALKLPGSARDLWKQEELGIIDDLSIRLAPHESRLLFIR